MRALAIVFLGCVPLAALTVSAFVELASIDSAPAGADALAGLDAYAHQAEQLRCRAETDGPLADALAGAELLDDDATAGLEDAEAGTPWAPLADAWGRWLSARALVAEFVRIDRLTATSDLGELNRAVADLEDLKQKCAASGARDHSRLETLIDRRTAELGREIVRLEEMREAAALLGRARAAFVPNRYGDCVVHCDQLLSQYMPALEPGVVEKVRLLRQRAQFWHDAERLFAELDEGDAPDARAARLEAFLGKYADRAYRTASELRILDQCGQQLLAARAQLDAEQKDRAAAALLDELTADPPPQFDDRLGAAARLVVQYPTPRVRSALRASVGRWLVEFLPEKQVAEHPMLQEAETADGKIIRGFFKAVQAGGGEVVGYKRYPTQEQLLNPVAEVGTYRAGDLRSGPGPSVPRDCATRYNQARQGLLQQPGAVEAWTEFADLCDALQRALEEYRNKPGSEPSGPLSFESEGRFARRLATGPGVAQIKQVVGP